jgi:hypothetical protein
MGRMKLFASCNLAVSCQLLVSGEKNEARPNDLAFFMVD